MKIRGLVSSDRPQWVSLYRGYAVFYKVDTDDAKLDTLFTWLLAASHPCEGLVAEVDDGQKAEGALVGRRISLRCHPRCVVPRLVFWMICSSTRPIGVEVPGTGC